MPPRWPLTFRPALSYFPAPFLPLSCTGYFAAFPAQVRRAISALEVLCLARGVVDSASEAPGFIRSAMQNTHAMPDEVNGVATGNGRHRDVIHAPRESPIAHQLGLFEAKSLEQVVACEQISVELLDGETSSHGRRIWRKKYAVFRDQGS